MRSSRLSASSQAALEATGKEHHGQISETHLPPFQFEVGSFHELARGPGFHALILDKLGFEYKKGRERPVDPRSDNRRAIRNDRMAEANLEFTGDPLLAVREEAVCHRAIEQRGDDSPVKQSWITFKGLAAAEPRLHTPIVQQGELEAKAAVATGAAHEAVRVREVVVGRRAVQRRVNGSERGMRFRVFHLESLSMDLLAMDVQQFTRFPARVGEAARWQPA